MRTQRRSGGGLNLPVLLSFNELAWMAMFLVVVLLFSSMIRARKLSGRLDALGKVESQLTNLTATVHGLVDFSNRWVKADLGSELDRLSRSNAALADQLQRLQKAAARLAGAALALETASNELVRLRALRVADAEEISRLREQVAHSIVPPGSERSEKTVRRELLGLGGPVSNVAFIVDVSSSMKDLGTVRMPDGRMVKESYWNQTRTTISNWLGLLPVHRCALIAFNEAPRLVRPRGGTNGHTNDLVEVAGPAGAVQREALLKEFGSLTPSGNTDTYAALELASQIRGIDTIIIFSDGHPNPAAPLADSMASISNLVRRARLPPINTIGVGSYEGDKEAIAFLVSVAKQTGGTFIVR